MREMWCWLGRKSILIVSLIGLLAFSGCGAMGQSFTLEDATAAGMLMPFNELAGADFGSDFEVVEVVRQDLIGNARIAFQLYFPIREALVFTANEGDLTLYVRRGQAVQEGDILARLSFDATVELELAHFNANQRLRQFEEILTSERERRQAAIADLRAESGYEQQTALEIQRLETGLQIFELTNQARGYALREDVAAIYQLLTGENLIAPFDGIVLAINYIGTNTRITVADCSVFFLKFETFFEPERRRQHYDLMGHGDIVAMRSLETYDDEHGEEQPYLQFDAQVVTEVWASGRRMLYTYLLRPVHEERLFDALEQLAEELDEEVDSRHPLYILMQKTIFADVDVVYASNALTLPAGAIREEANEYYVFIYNDGNHGKRYVQVDGTRLGGYVTVLSGLDEGTKVVILP